MKIRLTTVASVPMMEVVEKQLKKLVFDTSNIIPNPDNPIAQARARGRAAILADLKRYEEQSKKTSQPDRASKTPNKAG